MAYGLFKRQKQEALTTSPDVPKDCTDCALTENYLGDRTTRLSQYGPGERGTICRICGDPDFRRRMMEMGFTRGTEVTVVKYAPLSDPIEFVVKGYHITLRREQAEDILMNEPGIAA